MLLQFVAEFVYFSSIKVCPLCLLATMFPKWVGLRSSVQNLNSRNHKWKHFRNIPPIDISLYIKAAALTPFFCFPYIWNYKIAFINYWTCLLQALFSCSILTKTTQPALEMQIMVIHGLERIYEPFFFFFFFARAIMSFCDRGAGNTIFGNWTQILLSS